MVVEAIAIHFYYWSAVALGLFLVLSFCNETHFCRIGCVVIMKSAFPVFQMAIYSKLPFQCTLCLYHNNTTKMCCFPVIFTNII